MSEEETLQNLLELYKAEKEKNKELTDLVETIQELKPVMEIVHEMEKFEDEFISKDKIKEKIKEIQDLIDYNNERKQLSDLVEELEEQKELLQELLEE